MTQESDDAKQLEIELIARSQLKLLELLAYEMAQELLHSCSSEPRILPSVEEAREL